MQPLADPNIPTTVLSLESYDHNWHLWSLTRHTNCHCLKSNLRQNSRNVEPALRQTLRQNSKMCYRSLYNQQFWTEFPNQFEEVKQKIFQDALFAKADGTIDGYLYKCRIFFAWLKELKIIIKLPVQDEIIAAFLVNVRSNTNSERAINSTAAGLKWLHSLVNSK